MEYVTSRAHGAKSKSLASPPQVLADLALPKEEVRALALDRAASIRGGHDKTRDRRNLYLVRMRRYRF